MVPTQNRPRASQAPSLKRTPLGASVREASSVTVPRSSTNKNDTAAAATYPACGGRSHHADVAVHLDRLDQAGLAVARQGGTVYPAAENIDPQKLLALLMPARSLAEQPWLGRPHTNRGGAHARRSTTTLTSSGPRFNASAHRSSGTRRVIIADNHVGSAAASAATA